MVPLPPHLDNVAVQYIEFLRTLTEVEMVYLLGMNTSDLILREIYRLQKSNIEGFKKSASRALRIYFEQNTNGEAAAVREGYTSMSSLTKIFKEYVTKKILREHAKRLTDIAREQEEKILQKKYRSKQRSKLTRDDIEKIIPKPRSKKVAKPSNPYIADL